MTWKKGPWLLGFKILKFLGHIKKIISLLHRFNFTNVGKNWATIYFYVSILLIPIFSTMTVFTLTVPVSDKIFCMQI
jgi:hypothetical protein